MNAEKIAVITGATSGIGTAVAKKMASEGITVVLVGRNDTWGKCLANDILSSGRKALFVKCDVTDEEQVAQLAEEVGRKYEKVDILFNNAGIMPEARELELLSGEEWQKVFDSNINSIFYVIKHFKPLLFCCKGCIINNASIAGMHSYIAGRSYSYSASKAAVIQFTRQMALNYATEGVRVNCICPGIIDTPILGTRNREDYARRIPLGYIGKPEEVANVVSFLASEQASYLTGVVLPVDGGGQFVASESTVFSVAACYSNQPLLKTLEDIVHKSGISKLHEKNILLTGGTGFVGYYTVLALLYANDSLELNNKVILVVRDYKKALAGFGGMILRSDIRIMIQDIRERFILPDQCNIDYIIHCAMTSETSAMENDPLGVFYTAIAGTKNIIRLAEEKRVKSLVYLSSVTVYGGDSFDNHKISEDYTGVRDWKKDQDCYSLGKRSGEFLCLAEHRKRGLPVKILRPGYVYGASFREDNRVYAQIINAAAAGKNIVLRSGGYLCRPMVHVADLVKGIFLTLTDGEDGTAYNVSTAYCTIREFAQIAANSGEVCLTFEHETDIPYDKKRIVHTGNMDCKRMEDLAGKEIFYSLEKGIYSSIIVEAALFDCEKEQEYII